MTAVGTETREGQVHLFVELKLIFDDFEGGGALLVAGALVSTANGFFEDGVPYILDVVREIFCFYRYLIVPFFGVFLRITFLYRLFFGHCWK